MLSYLSCKRGNSCRTENCIYFINTSYVTLNLFKKSFFSLKPFFQKSVQHRTSVKNRFIERNDFIVIKKTLKLYINNL